MEWLLWLTGIPVLCLLMLWAASKFTFPRKPSGSNGSSGFFDAFSDLYNPSSSPARTELDEQKRRIAASAQGQDKDPLAGFHAVRPREPESGPPDASPSGP